MARPFGAAASAEAHERLREEREAGEEETGKEVRSWKGPPGAHEAALAAGSAVHRALEEWDLDAQPAPELARQLARLPALVAGVAAPEQREAAADRARALLTRAFSAGLVARLHASRDSVVARELPVLLPPPADGAGAVGYVSGTIDLLYRGADGGLVVADFKTDQVEGEALTRRAAAYATQGAAYTRAVQEALGLRTPPRFELWFLAAGEII
ncbi:MAG TPA: PD-(D/E)XK nuclease family protein, partial [Thermoanaerobaculia bacterium]|nr:PD-(D/E)XK nuclease family protein [Thermoanaerobaculia bacterium]